MGTQCDTIEAHIKGSRSLIKKELFAILQPESNVCLEYLKKLINEKNQF